MSVDFGLILEEQISDLLDLIGFRHISNGLLVDNFLHSVLVEEGMASFAGFAGEARAFEEVANVGEGDVRVGSSRENVGECFAEIQSASCRKLSQSFTCKAILLSFAS